MFNPRTKKYPRQILHKIGNQHFIATTQPPICRDGDKMVFLSQRQRVVLVYAIGNFIDLYYYI